MIKVLDVKARGVRDFGTFGAGYLVDYEIDLSIQFEGETITRNKRVFMNKYRVEAYDLERNLNIIYEWESPANIRKCHLSRHINKTIKDAIVNVDTSCVFEIYKNGVLIDVKRRYC